MYVFKASLSIHKLLINFSMHVHRQSKKKYPNVTKKVVKLFFFILGVIGILIGFLMAAGGKIIPN